jgi:haloacetate dehalogenase
VFDGFAAFRTRADGITINGVRGGDGPPLLLLHGYPQTHVMWHRVAPRLAQRFAVVCPDLRGYGDSDGPPSDAGHEPYGKREMARDQLALMRELGFARFATAAHDRDARVARRLALDHPDAVDRLAVLDIVPTHVVYRDLDQRHATTVWRYFFLTQESDLPERLIGADPGYYLDYTMDEWCGTDGAVAAEARDEYRRCFDPPPCTRPARTTGRERRSTSATTRPTPPPGSAAPSWCCGARAASASHTTSSTSGAARPTTCAAGRWTAVISSPRSAPMRSPPRSSTS